MTPIKLLVVSAAVALISACTTPSGIPTEAMTTYDDDTKYLQTPTDSGFKLVVYYSRYQFFPESNAVEAACRSMLTSIAYELADKEGKPIEKINEQRIRISMGRNGMTGITSCLATGVVNWDKSSK